MFKVIFLFVAGDSVSPFFSLRPRWRKASYNTGEQDTSSLGNSCGCLLLLIIPNGAKMWFFFLIFRSGIINPRFGAALSNYSAFCLFKVPPVVPVEQNVLFRLWFNDLCTAA